MKDELDIEEMVRRHAAAIARFIEKEQQEAMWLAYGCVPSVNPQLVVVEEGAKEEG